MTFLNEANHQFSFLKDISLDIEKIIEKLGADMYERVKYHETSKLVGYSYYTRRICASFKTKSNVRKKF